MEPCPACYIYSCEEGLNYVQSSFKGHCECCQTVCVCAYACLDISAKCHISEAFGGWKASLLGHTQSQVTFLPSLMPMAQHNNISFHQSTVPWCEKSNGMWRGIISSLDRFRLQSAALNMAGDGFQAVPPCPFCLEIPKRDNCHICSHRNEMKPCWRGVLGTVMLL